MSNKRNWLAQEEKLFQEIYTIGWEAEANKSLTKEALTKGGLNEVRKTARTIA